MLRLCGGLRWQRLSDGRVVLCKRDLRRVRRGVRQLFGSRLRWSRLPGRRLVLRDRRQVCELAGDDITTSNIVAAIADEPMAEAV